MNPYDEPEYESWAESAARGLRNAIIIAVIVLVLLVVVGLRIKGNLDAHAVPPVQCQLFGGSWSLWSGWHRGQG